MPVKKFRKKPVEIEAIQWTGDNLKEVMEFTSLMWIGGFPRFDDCKERVRRSGGAFKVITNHGATHARPGDWIIKGRDGEFYPCKPDLFGELYDEVVPEPKATDIEKNAPHIVVSCGETVHVVPLSVIENIAHGSMSIRDVEMWEPIFRKVLGEWFYFLPDNDDEYVTFRFDRWGLHATMSYLVEIFRGERPILKDDDCIKVVDIVSQEWARRKLNEYAGGVEG